MPWTSRIWNGSEMRSVISNESSKQLVGAERRRDREREARLRVAEDVVHAAASRTVPDSGEAENA